MVLESQRQEKLILQLIWVRGARIQLINIFEWWAYDSLSLLAPSPVLENQSICSQSGKLVLAQTRWGEMQVGPLTCLLWRGEKPHISSIDVTRIQNDMSGGISDTKTLRGTEHWDGVSILPCPSVQLRHMVMPIPVVNVLWERWTAGGSRFVHVDVSLLGRNMRKTEFSFGKEGSQEPDKMLARIHRKYSKLNGGNKQEN